MSAKKLIKIKPQAFVHDERSKMGLAIFEEIESRVKFSVALDSFVNLDLFLRESFKKEESGFSLSYKVMEEFGYEIDLALLDLLPNNETKSVIYLKHKSDSSMPLKEMNVRTFELLGLWHSKDFQMFASSEFIESSKNIVIKKEENSDPNLKNLHKKYGQKYLI